MKVVIDEALFNDPANDRDLLHLLDFAVDGRHIVLIEPEFVRDEARVVYRWLRDHKPSVREQMLAGLENSIKEEATALRRAFTLRVSARPDPHDPLSMSLSAARALLRRPLLIIVENERNDGAFVQLMLPPDYRERLRQKLNDEWVKFISGGGLGELRKHIERLDGPAHLRAVAVFDSDAHVPNTPSPESEQVRELCESRGVAHHQLLRRASENYLPLRALGEWVGRDFSHPDQPHRCYHAYRRLPSHGRHHFNMKGGLSKDRSSNPPRVAPLFDSLPARDCEALERGFTDAVTALFHEGTFKIQEAWLEEESHDERRKLVELIFSRL